LYIPSQDLWVGEYPILQRDVFVDVSNDLRPRRARPRSRPPARRVSRRSRYPALARRREFCG
ncbi:MAG: phosphate ABC transporter permease, partial [Spirulinaceae cyanobacterium RM2_2_10]|nr:phosphate ABC transporter permease [Spirulinaceae cyanobacterium RM2_2_10]